MINEKEQALYWAKLFYQAVHQPEYQYEKNRNAELAAEHFLEIKAIDEFVSERKELADLLLEIARQRRAVEKKQRVFVQLSLGQAVSYLKDWKGKWGNYAVRQDYGLAAALYKGIGNSNQANAVWAEYDDYCLERKGPGQGAEEKEQK